MYRPKFRVRTSYSIPGQMLVYLGPKFEAFWAKIWAISYNTYNTITSIPRTGGAYLIGNYDQFWLSILATFGSWNKISESVFVTCYDLVMACPMLG
jgi:hypothetical protein